MSFIEELFSLQGKTALITGGGSGLGAEMALALSGAGAGVILVGRRTAPLQVTCQNIQAQGGQARFISADISTDAGLQALFQDVRQGGASVDILINAAGINVRKPAAELSLGEWDQTLRLNLTVPFLLAREWVGAMAEKSWGRIINIGSLQSVRAFPDSMPYGATKGGIVQLTRAMAEAWSGSGVCCNAIAPGLFPTELTQSIYQNPQLLAAMAAKTCCGRNAELSDIRGLTVFLASPAAGFLTGQTIFLDGGLTAK